VRALCIVINAGACAHTHTQIILLAICNQVVVSQQFKEEDTQTNVSKPHWDKAVAAYSETARLMEQHTGMLG